MKVSVSEQGKVTSINLTDCTIEMPDEFVPVNKYIFDGQNWILDPDYVEPEQLQTCPTCGGTGKIKAV